MSFIICVMILNYIYSSQRLTEQWRFRSVFLCMRVQKLSGHRTRRNPHYCWNTLKISQNVSFLVFFFFKLQILLLITFFLKVYKHQNTFYFSCKLYIEYLLLFKAWKRTLIHCTLFGTQTLRQYSPLRSKGWQWRLVKLHFFYSSLWPDKF